MLLTVVLSACILSAFFVANNLVINDNEVEAAAGADYLNKACGTNVIFNYYHSTGKIEVVPKSGYTNPQVDKAKFQSYAGTVTAYTGSEASLVSFTGVQMPKDCSAFFSKCTEASNIVFTNVD